MQPCVFEELCATRLADLGGRCWLRGGGALERYEAGLGLIDWRTRVGARLPTSSYPSPDVPLPCEGTISYRKVGLKRLFCLPYSRDF